MGSTNEKKKIWLKRKKRISKKIISTVDRPRLTVFRSAKHIYGQIVDDTTGTTIVAASTTEKAVKDQPAFENKVARAVFTGKLLAQRAIDKGVKKVVFDRNGFLYHGRIKALSDGAREAGLDF
ncbi:50S ribosomal protein L18 [Desulfosarcina alkanivorans]|jgi:large subunit ribosomal protein L18|uniref:Large ribosomal subunit protein uL18 n=1 Tax=Desulfosarcina alkanivorans TaxID=571177 RepID=A0A5K7YGI6_9BACT|nr:50S ribosomal protein L18 [Desulfosarcina alkanivorans]BBO68198.1 50S ribosomal protein L18 [Desulfosarcina alkanivorans]